MTSHNDANGTLVRRLREIVARGWCDDRNCNKPMDPVLAESIVKELLLSLDPGCHPSRSLRDVIMPLRRRDSPADGENAAQ